MLTLVLCRHDLPKCGIVILLPLVRFDNQLVLDKLILIMTMAKIISKKSSVKASAAKPSGKPPSRDKTLGVDPEIRFYAIEDGGETEEGEES